MTEETQGGLSAAEQAYFDSAGETMPAEDTTAAAPDPVNQPEPVAGEPEAATDRDEKGRFVPHGALHAEREEHKRTKSELSEIRQKQAVLEDRWNTLLSLQQSQQTKAEEPPPPPDPDQDIFAFSKWQADRLAALESRITEDQQRQQQTVQEQQQEQALWSEWSQAAQSFAAEKADFGDAVKFLSEARDKQLQALGFADKRFSDQGARVQQINAELKQIILSAKQQNMSPAEAVYQIALGYGFQTQQQPAPNQLNEKLAALDAAQTASRTLAASNGKQAGDAMTAEAIASMSPADFERWAADPANQRRLDKLLGG